MKVVTCLLVLACLADDACAKMELFVFVIQRRTVNSSKKSGIGKLKFAKSFHPQAANA